MDKNRFHTAPRRLLPRKSKFLSCFESNNGDLNAVSKELQISISDARLLLGSHIPKNDADGNSKLYSMMIKPLTESVPQFAENGKKGDIISIIALTNILSINDVVGNPKLYLMVIKALIGSIPALAENGKKGDIRRIKVLTNILSINDVVRNSKLYSMAMKAIKGSIPALVENGKKGDIRSIEALLRIPLKTGTGTGTGKIKVQLPRYDGEGQVTVEWAFVKEDWRYLNGTLVHMPTVEWVLRQEKGNA